MQDRSIGRSGEPSNPSHDPDVFRVALYPPDTVSLARLVRELGLDIDHQHPSVREILEIQAFLTRAQIEEVQTRGWRVDVAENLSVIGRARQEEVGTGDRYEGGTVVPRGLGKKSEEVR